MKVLIADDDPGVRRMLKITVSRLGHEIELAGCGDEAWTRFRATPFDIVISDWMMPGMDGPSLCRKIRGRIGGMFCYVILLTARDSKEDCVEGIMAGADAFLTKPWNAAELKARLHAAERVVRLERDLEQRVAELEAALREVHELRGLLPVCMYCKDIRRDEEVWQDIVQYMTEHSDADFTHSICPPCYENRVQPEIDAFVAKQEQERAEKAG